MKHSTRRSHYLPLWLIHWKNRQTCSLWHPKPAKVLPNTFMKRCNAIQTSCLRKLAWRSCGSRKSNLSALLQAPTFRDERRRSLEKPGHTQDTHDRVDAMAWLTHPSVGKVHVAALDSKGDSIFQKPLHPHA